jgi:hypothetical protein
VDWKNNPEADPRFEEPTARTMYDCRRCLAGFLSRGGYAKHLLAAGATRDKLTACVALQLRQLKSQMCLSTVVAKKKVLAARTRADWLRPEPTCVLAFGLAVKGWKSDDEIYELGFVLSQPARPPISHSISLQAPGDAFAATTMTNAAFEARVATATGTRACIGADGQPCAGAGTGAGIGTDAGAGVGAETGLGAWMGIETETERRAGTGEGDGKGRGTEMSAGAKLRWFMSVVRRVTQHGGVVVAHNVNRTAKFLACTSLAHGFVWDKSLPIFCTLLTSGSVPESARGGGSKRAPLHLCKAAGALSCAPTAGPVGDAHTVLLLYRTGRERLWW